MAKVREYIVQITIPLASGKMLLPPDPISKEEYTSLGIYQDRVIINETEIRDDLLPKIVAENPLAEVVSESKEEVVETVSEKATEPTISLEEARTKWEELYGKKPHHFRKLESLLEDIANKS
jgi:DNA-directed RNA polymerase subunit H (RpoH/RPB5)